MAFVSSLVLVCLACFANDVVELEPVKALSFHCSLLNNQETNCNANPYCKWTNPNCEDDVCLINSARVLTGDGDTCDAVTPAETCKKWDLTNIANAPAYVPSLLTADCSNATVNTGWLCASDKSPNKVWTYCAYAYIRDQACPASICETNTVDVGCVPATPQQCQMLSENDCKNVPKCLWNGSQKCVQDPCFFGSDQQNCATYIPDPTYLATIGWTTVPAGDCIDFKPLKSGSTNIANYCVYKTNTNPNICYFAPTAKLVNDTTNPNYATDWTVTYPTYNLNSTNVKPSTCEGQLAGCEGTGDCYTTLNQRGALAGLYCTDGTHGAASVLRIPSMLLFLVVCALSMFIA